MGKKDALLSSLSGLLFALSFPPSPFGPLGFVALVPLFEALRDKDFRTSFLVGYLFSLVVNVGCLYWICWATVPGGIAAILVASIYGGVFSLLFWWLRRISFDVALTMTPLIWVSVEYIRSLGQLAFPWTNVGYMLADYPCLIQFASFTGVWGVSLWMVIANVLVYYLLRDVAVVKKRMSIIFSLALLLVLPYLYGKRVMDDTPSGNVSVALLQGNIDPHLKWDRRYIDYSFRVFFEMSRMGKGTDLIVWPETAAPCYLRHQRTYRERVQELTDQLGVPMLVGAPDYQYEGEGRYRTFNAVMLFEPGVALHQWYYKNHLVPFSEHIPFDDHIPLLQRVNAGEADFSQGRELTLFQLPEGKFATLICFESIFPDLVRRFVRRGADFLINVTNDGWFGRTSGPFQHAEIAVFRAIENRIGLARCANTGVSVIIDPFGRCGQETNIFARETIVGRVSSTLGETFYTRYGDWIARGCLWITIIVAFVPFVVRRGRANR